MNNYLSENIYNVTAGTNMSNNDDIDNDDIDSDDIELNVEESEDSLFHDKKTLSKDKMEYKRKLEEYLENKRLEDELNYY